MRSRALFLALLLALLCSHARPAHADDVADEADLQFQIGAERYQAGDHLGALEHFLASNRLVPNRNVSYNIARCYEQLKKYPEAYRYYVQALEGETVEGARQRVNASLESIKSHVALLDIVTDPPGAAIYINRRDLGSRGESPRALGLAPGRYKVIVDKPGFYPTESQDIDVAVADKVRVSLVLRPRVEDLTGSLVVNADERGALIEIDGKPRAFTPAILTVPAGPHAIRVSLKGFRPIAQSVDVPPNAERRLELVLTQAEEVTAASRTTETVEQAPSSVSIVRSEELRGMGYPTIDEALRGVRGVYVWDDRTYTSLGFRGLGRLGGYGNRVLVLLDGQPTNDNWLGSSYTGFDARSDLEDIERIEVIRGPGSVLYGTNAFSGVVNLVTRDVGETSSLEAGASVVEYGVARGRLRYNWRIAEGASLWTSVAGTRSDGRDYYFPEFATTTRPDLAGNARGVDGSQGGTINGRFTWGAFTTQWLLQSRNKHTPTSSYDTLFADPRFQQIDTRGLVEARFEPVVTDGVQLLSRAHYNVYNFHGVYPRAPAQSGVEHDRYAGNWLGLEQRVVLLPIEAVRLTVGGEVQVHTRAAMTNSDDSGTWLDSQNPYDVEAAYVLADLKIPRARFSLGTRLDHYSTFGYSTNPRLAIVLTPYEGGNLKILAGKAFRAPSVYELYYNDNGSTQVASPGLSPESIYSGELEFSHRFSPTVIGTVAGFSNVATNLVVLKDIGTGIFQYQNSDAPLLTLGTEAELRREWRQGWMLAASYSAQHSHYLPLHATLKDALKGRENAALRHVSNAPEHLASLKGAVPILSHGLVLSTRMSLEGPRWDRHEDASDPVPQAKTEAAVVWDLVLSGEEARWGLRYAFGVYNAFDWRYTTPLSVEFRQNTIVQPGRTFLASANVTF
jgi:outer membrane receptor for ferrienterochelin and colicin